MLERDAVTPIDLGPQYEGDTAFVARMRFHQSWYRSEVLRCGFGVGPGKKGRDLGSMLTESDGARGRNFVSPEAFAAAERRLSEKVGVVEEYRLLHNMLSSQPMCFNLFAPLVSDVSLARKVVRRILGSAVEVTSIGEHHFEWPPTPTDLLGDGTAFDFYVEYETPNGPGFVGFETKLTEPFSQNRYPAERYERWWKRADAPFLESGRARLDDVAHNQLWRDHLLAFSMFRRPGSRFTGGSLALVRHPGDEHCAEIVKGYCELLVPGDQTFIDLPLDQLVRFVRTELDGAPVPDWLQQFENRYLNLSASEALWTEHAASRRGAGGGKSAARGAQRGDAHADSDGPRPTGAANPGGGASDPAESKGSGAHAGRDSGGGDVGPG